MLTRTHFVFAVFVFLMLFNYLSKYFNSLEIMLFFIFLLIGTFLIDVDSKKSRFGKKWYLRPLQWVVSHRGIFHTLFFVLVLAGIIYFFNRSAGFGFLLGGVLHLFLDLLTRQGVMLFWPLSGKRVKLFFLRSGGLIEEIFFVLLLLADLWLFFRVFLIRYI